MAIANMKLDPNAVKSEPPEGKQQVTNIYRNPTNNRLVVKHKA